MPMDSNASEVLSFIWVHSIPRIKVNIKILVYTIPHPMGVIFLPCLLHLGAGIILCFLPMKKISQPKRLRDFVFINL